LIKRIFKLVEGAVLLVVTSTVAAILAGYGYDPKWFLSLLFGAEIADSLLAGTLQFSSGDLTRTLILLAGVAIFLAGAHRFVALPVSRLLEARRAPPSAAGRNEVAPGGPPWVDKAADLEAWRQTDHFPVWQAACLWAGREPHFLLAVAYGTPVYPCFSMLLRHIQRGEIVVSRHEPEMAWSELSRPDLVKLAAHKGVRPAFLFIDAGKAPAIASPTDMIPLEEFATTAYERTKDGMVGKLAAKDNDENAILLWYANFAGIKFPIHGCRPPSRLIEVVDRTGYHFACDIDRIILQEMYGKAKWTNLRMRQADASQCYAMLDRFDPMGATGQE